MLTHSGFAAPTLLCIMAQVTALSQVYNYPSKGRAELLGKLCGFFDLDAFGIAQAKRVPQSLESGSALPLVTRSAGR